MHRQNGAYASLSHFTSITCMNACIISYFFLFCFPFFYSRCVSVCLCVLNRRIVEMENTHNFVTAKLWICWSHLLGNTVNQRRWASSKFALTRAEGVRMCLCVLWEFHKQNSHFTESAKRKVQLLFKKRHSYKTMFKLCFVQVFKLDGNDSNNTKPPC